MTSLALRKVPLYVDDPFYPAWDLYVDALGNIATVDNYDQMAQDVACRCRVFLGEVYYNTAQGIPYDTKILNQFPPKSLVAAQLTAQALAVTGVVKAQVNSLQIIDRKLTGIIECTDADGVSRSVSF